MAERSLRARLERQLEPELMSGERAVQVYDALAHAHHFLDKAFARKVLSLGVSEGLALDVGCASGAVSILLSEGAPALSVVGLDLSEPMLRIAGGRAGEGDGRGLCFVLGDARRLPFPDATFDLVVSHHTLHHLPEPEAMLAEMVRVARPGGWVAVRDLCRPARRWKLEFFVRVYGCIYGKLGEDAPMARQLYRQSLQAALSRREWEALAGKCGAGPESVRHHAVSSHTDLIFRRQ
jgi:ubiquinone/menaquinone biosynthesis C-methylase UbiE